MAHTVTKWALRVPDLTDVPDIPADFENLATDLSNIAMDTQGVSGSRPVSTPGSPGKTGRYYKSTDTGVLERDKGDGWEQIVLGNDSRMADQRTPLDASVILAKMAAGVGSRLLATPTMAAYTVTSGGSSNVVNNVPVTHNGKGGIAFFFHSMRVSASPSTAVWSFIIPDGIATRTYTHTMSTVGMVGLACHAANYNPMSGSQLWRVNVNQSSGGTVTSDNGTGLLVIVENY